MSPEIVGYVDIVKDFLHDNGVVLGLLLIFVLVAIFLTKKAPGEVALKKITKGEYVLSRRQQKLREHSLIADGIAELLLNLHVKGELTDERYHYWHLRFGTQLALKELLPTPLTPEGIKNAIKKRTTNGFYKPVKLPGEKPALKPKSVVDKILSRHFPSPITT